MQKQLEEAQAKEATLTTQLQDARAQAWAHCAVLTGFRVMRVCMQLELANETRAVLESNISRLYATAKLEIKRKGEEIIRLRRLYALLACSDSESGGILTLCARCAGWKRSASDLWSPLSTCASCWKC